MKFLYVLKVAVKLYTMVPTFKLWLWKNSTYCKLELFIAFADIFTILLDSYICVWKSPASDNCFFSK